VTSNAEVDDFRQAVKDKFSDTCSIQSICVRKPVCPQKYKYC
jgi:hypothetical protein